MFYPREYIIERVSYVLVRKYERAGKQPPEFGYLQRVADKYWRMVELSGINGH